MKLCGGSLFYALAITVIMALVSSSILLAAHYSRLQIQQDEFREKSIRNARSGMELLLGISSVNFQDDLDLFGEGRDSVQLIAKPWGALEIGISSSHGHSITKELIAFIGCQNNSTDHTALILADMDRPLSISGETKLKGDCYLPKAGIQRAYIEGNSYNGDQLVDGQIRNSERFLPKYNDTLIDQIKKLFSYSPSSTDSIYSIAQLDKTDSIQHSFKGAPLYLYSGTDIHLNHQSISGQVCIISKTKIFIGKHSSLHSVLLIAPKIEIENQAEGDFQAFASDSILVGENVRLQYPTVLGIIGTESSPDQAAIFIGQKANVFGQVFGCTISKDIQKHVLIKIEKESLVYGEVYCSDLVDHQGSVYGEMTCSKFQLKTQSAEYENHLLNATIDRSKRSPYFVSSALTSKMGDKKKVIQWLN